MYFDLDTQSVHSDSTSTKPKKKKSTTKAKKVRFFNSTKNYTLQYIFLYFF